jgi:zinc finger HIT domain-containing protein 1
MNNFGVIELASTRTTNAPGWAYVPDSQRVTPITAASSKRKRGAANGGATLSLADANARQETKFRREIEVLDRDNARDMQQIAIPAKNKNKKQSKAVSSTLKKQYTPNVRKILQSQKTFANHLDDYVAQEAANPGAAAGGGGGGGGTGAGNETTGAAKRPGQRQQQQQQQASTSTTTSKKPTTITITKQQEPEEDVEMLDASSDPSSSSRRPRSTILTPLHAPSPAPHIEDANPLLASHLPPIPSDNELRALLAAPPLSYLEARGTTTRPSGAGAGAGGGGTGGKQYPARVFCVVCGYWGRVRCLKCGTRVCALECLETHREECVTRYGL